MSKSILLIDDKESFKDDFKVIAQANGYNLAWGKSLSDLKRLVPVMNLKITAIVLDIKCLIDNDQMIERSDFIGAALSYLDQNFPDLPRLILTGDEGALEAIKMIHSPEKENIYKKEPNEIEKLFEKVDDYFKKHEERILTNDEKHIKLLLSNAEGKHLEFKSSLQYSVRESKENTDLRFEVLKNIAAFANTEGGEILIGVEDNKNVIGLEDTDYQTLKEGNKEDLYRLLIDNLIESNFGNSFQQNLPDLKFYKIQNKTICKVKVNKYHKHVFIIRKNKNDEVRSAFFIRRQGSTAELKNEEIDAYIEAHWN